MIMSSMIHLLIATDAWRQFLEPICDIYGVYWQYKKLTRIYENVDWIGEHAFIDLIRENEYQNAHQYVLK